MAQLFEDFLGDEKIRISRPKIAQRGETLRSCFSGTTAPTTPSPTEGQLFFNTSTRGFHQYRGSGWIEIAMLPPFATVAALRAVSATESVGSGQIALVLGGSAIGDCPPFYVQWVAASASTHDGYAVFRPTAGAAASGNGRWVRINVNPAVTFTNSDATPSIANCNFFVTAGTPPAAITDFDDAHENQWFVVRRGAADQPITHNASVIDCGGADIVLTATAPRALFVHIGGVHYLVSQGLNLADLVAKSGATMTGALTLSGDPSNALHAATKQYVDMVAAGFDGKASVKAASTANLSLSGAQTVDGVSLIAGDRCLVKNQTTTSLNGVYVVAAGSWTRAADMDAWTEIPGAWVAVEQGTANAESVWLCSADQGGTLNTTAITWTQLFGPGLYQLASALLASIAAIASNGLLARTAAGTAAARSIAAGAGITVTNGDAVSGNPTVAISAGGVTASRKAIGDQSNLVDDVDFLDSAYWSNSGALTFASTDAKILSDLGAPRGVRTADGNGTTSQGAASLTTAAANYFQIEPGRRYRMSAPLFAASGFTGWLRVGVLWYKQDGSASTTPNVYSQAGNYKTVAASADTVVQADEIVTAPADAHYARFQIYVDWSTTLNNAGYGAVARPRLRVQPIEDVLELDTIAALRALTRTGLDRPGAVLVERYTAGVANAGGGAFYYDSADTSTADDGGMVIVDTTGARWKRRPATDGAVDACWYGAHPSASAATNRNAIRAAIDYQAALGGGTVTFSVYGLYTGAKASGLNRCVDLKKGVKLKGGGRSQAGDTVTPYLRVVILAPSEGMDFFVAHDGADYETVTATIATPGVITWTAHGLSAGDKVYFTTSGALPTGITQLTTYFVSATDLTANTFKISATAGGAVINTSGSQSGTHTCVHGVAMHSIGLEDIVFWDGGQAVRDIVMVCPLFALFRNVTVQSSGTATNGFTAISSDIGVAGDPNFGSPISWINRFDGVACFYFEGGIGFNCEVSDSQVSNGHFGGSRINARIINGSNSIALNQFENGDNGDGLWTGVGLLIVASPLQPRLTNTFSTNRYNQNGTGILIERGSQYASVDLRCAFTGEMFHSSRYRHIKIGQGIRSGQITGGIFGEMAPAPTCTITIASPGVVTINSHQLEAGDPVVFSTSGSLPTGITAGVTYYVVASGLTEDTFQIAATVGGAAINTSGSQSGAHNCAIGIYHIKFHGTDNSGWKIDGHFDHAIGARIQNEIEDVSGLEGGEDGSVFKARVARFTGAALANLDSNVNDWAPGIAAATYLGVVPSGPYIITGITGGSAGRVLKIANGGPYDIVLANQSSSSAASNRIYSYSDVTIPAGGFAIIFWDWTLGAWRLESLVTPKCALDVFTSSATWTKRAGAVRVDVAAFAAGGSGGGGARPSGSNAASGGGGGGAGMTARATFSASDLAPSVSVTVAAATTGGAGATSDGNAGSDGAQGGYSAFGSHLRAHGGGGGAGGQLAGPSGGGGSGGVHGAGANGSGGTGGAGGFSGGVAGGSGAAGTGTTANGSGSGGGGGTHTAAAGFAGNLCMNGAGGGGAGGGFDGTNAQAGGSGGRSGEYQSATGAGGAATGAAGSAYASAIGGPGGGGGGGGGNASGAGGAGAAGANYGGAGGGGGVGRTGNGGAGGNGAPGLVLVWTYF